MFDKLRSLFVGEGKTGGDSGLYVYVRLEKAREIVRIRLAPEHELNWDDETNTFVTRKSIIGPETFARADAVFRFDSAKKLIGAEIDGGESVTEEDWRQYVASSPKGAAIP